MKHLIMAIHEPGTTDQASTMRIAIHRVPLEEVGGGGTTSAKFDSID